ncbi:ABC transporter ATP-binding protein [Mariniluteicoccus flavus]
MSVDALNRPPLVSPKPRRARSSTNLLRLWAYLRPYAAVFWTMAALDVANILATIAIPLITRRAIDGPITAGDTAGVWRWGLLALAIGVAAAAAVFVRRWISSAMTLKTETSIRLDLYAQLQRLPMAFHGQWQSGQLLSRMMNDLSTVRRFLSFGLLMLAVSLLQIALTIGLLLNLYAPLGVVVLIAVVPVVVLCALMERQYTKLSRQVQDQTGDVASRVQESVHGLRVIRAFGRRDWAYAKFDRQASTLFDTQLARVRLNSRFFTLLDVIPSLVAVVVLAMGAVAASQGRLTIGTLVAFMTLLMSLVFPVTVLGFLLAMAQESMTAADRICEVLDAPNDIEPGPVRLPTARGELAFEGVAFRFPDGDADVLHDITLRTRAGETIALVGGTGSGKSTFTALVPRLVDVTAGRITLDGHDLRDLDLADLRRQVATAFEDPTLFSMSARENLTLGRPDATDAEIAQAIDVAQAHFVHDLPWGLDTRIGEQGMSLSGGQRQRLALARAVLVRPSVLVLDDTLSALDIHTEALVEEALGRVLKEATAIVVAHRASTVMLADRVVMLVDGTIGAIGTHAELLATEPRYRELLSADFDAEREVLHD